MQDEQRRALVDPARRLRDAVEPVAMHATGSGSVRAQLAGLGLDRFQAYVWARAASMGEPASGLVVAAFGVFEPERLAMAYDTARAICARRRLLEVRASATARSLGQVLLDCDLTAVVSAPRRGCRLRQLPVGRCSPASPTCPGRSIRRGSSGEPATWCASTVATVTSRCAWRTDCTRWR